MIIRKVGVLSLAKIVAAVNGAVGLVAGGLLTIAALAGFGVSGSAGDPLALQNLAELFEHRHRNQHRPTPEGSPKRSRRLALCEQERADEDVDIEDEPRLIAHPAARPGSPASSPVPALCY